MLRKVFTPRWILTTLLVLAVFAGLVRLGFWQVDRLAQRRASNALILARITAGPIDLNTVVAQTTDAHAFEGMAYRSATVAGDYRDAESIILRNQVWQDRPGFHLLTPLLIEGTSFTVLVDRGWIALDEANPAQWSKYDSTGLQTVSGQLMASVNHRSFGAQDPPLSAGQTRLDAWNMVNLDRIRLQTSGDLLGVYLLAAPVGDNIAPPFRALETPDLSEGPHLGYALQWFSFAAVLALGYPFFVRKQLQDG